MKARVTITLDPQVHMRAKQVARAPHKRFRVDRRLSPLAAGGRKGRFAG